MDRSSQTAARKARLPTGPTQASAAEYLADFAIETYTCPIPDRVRNHAIELITDQAGLQVACARLPWSEAVTSYFSDARAPGNATVVYHGWKAHPETAAFVNAAFGHGQDYDDTCQLVQTHAGAVIIPVALAVGEHVGATGRQVLRATVAGLEVMLRVAHAVSPDCLRRGHHTPPAAGPFGAAVTAALLSGASFEQLVQALAIAGSFSGGLIEYTQSGGSVKRIHTAIPTTAGIRAAGLALRGLTGPLTVLEGAKGFTRVFADQPEPERLTDQLGEDWLIDQVGLKAYNCCYFIHAPIEATRTIVDQTGWKPDEIAAIDVGLSAHGQVHVGSIAHPSDPLGGQFSVQFTLAMTLLDEPPGLHSYSPAQLADRRLHEFADRVRVHVDATAEAEYPANWGAVVTVTTRSGESRTRRVRFAQGTPRNRMSYAEVWAKLCRNVAGLLPGPALEALRDDLDNLDALPDMSRLLSHLVCADRTPLPEVTLPKQRRADRVLLP